MGQTHAERNELEAKTQLSTVQTHDHEVGPLSRYTILQQL